MSEGEKRGKGEERSTTIYNHANTIEKASFLRCLAGGSVGSLYGSFHLLLLLICICSSSYSKNNPVGGCQRRFGESLSGWFVFIFHFSHHILVVSFLLFLSSFFWSKNFPLFSREKNW